MRLREERVNVQRRPVDRPASETDLQSFKEGTFDVKATSKEPVVEKRARVVEEVLVDKDVQERTQTVRDTVRRKDVDGEQVDGGKGNSGYDSFPQRFAAKTPPRVFGPQWMDKLLHPQWDGYALQTN